MISLLYLGDTLSPSRGIDLSVLKSRHNIVAIYFGNPISLGTFVMTSQILQEHGEYHDQPRHNWDDLANPTGAWTVL